MMNNVHESLRSHIQAMPKPGCAGSRACSVMPAGGAPRAARFARLALHAGLAALLLAGAPAAASRAAGAAPAALPPAAAIGGPAAQAAPAAAGGRDEPRTWLIKWRDPAQAKPLR